MGEAFQRQIWHPHWKRVEAEDKSWDENKWVTVGFQEEEVDVDGSRDLELKIKPEIAKHNALNTAAYDEPLSPHCSVIASELI
jgi:hypothetical protein